MSTTIFRGGFYMCNIDIRLEARVSGVKLWEVAEALGMHDSGFSRKLRKELPEQEKTAIRAIIERLQTKKSQEAQ
ncbi:MAG: hypothetical protein FWH22_11325 [Fibromonadales bacterium]|nr:hypothetical protein [Fibromonadales bacterium]